MATAYLAALPAMMLLVIAFGWAFSAKALPEEALNATIHNAWARHWPRASQADLQPAPAQADRALAFAERVVDRQVNKVRGVLSFNALSLAVIAFEKTRLSTEVVSGWTVAIQMLLLAIMLLLAVSSFICLLIFRVKWPPPETFLTFKSDFENVTRLAALRTRKLERAIRLAIAGLVAGVLVLLAAELAQLIAKHEPEPCVSQSTAGSPQNAKPSGPAAQPKR